MSLAPRSTSARRHQGRMPRRSATRGEAGFTLVELLVVVAILGLVMGAIATVQITGQNMFLSGENQAEVQQTARTSMLMEEDLRLIGYGVPPSQARITAASPTAITFAADLLNASSTLAADVNPGNSTFSLVSAAGITGGNIIYLINGSQFEAHTVSSVAGNAVTVSTPGGATALFPLNLQVGRPRTVNYTWTAGTQIITKDAGDGTGVQTLATGVPAFQLRYFDTTDAEILPANLAANLANIRRISITVTAQSAMTVSSRSFTMTADVRPRNL